MRDNTASRKANTAGPCFLVNTTEFSSPAASNVRPPRNALPSTPPATVNDKNPFDNTPGDFTCTA